MVLIRRNNDNIPSRINKTNTLVVCNDIPNMSDNPYNIFVTEGIGSLDKITPNIVYRNANLSVFVNSFILSSFCFTITFCQ